MSRLSDQRAAARREAKALAGIAAAEFERLLDGCFASTDFWERNWGAELIAAMPGPRRGLDPERLTLWLRPASSWGDVDSLCTRFGAADLLGNWAAWERALWGLGRGEGWVARRASLVLLTRPVRESADPALAALGFALIEHLRADRRPLVAKAISWLLRDLIKHHRDEVEEYLERRADLLPAVAVRETRNKLRTGTKRGHGGAAPRVESE